MSSSVRKFLLTISLIAMGAAPALAEDTLKIAVGQRGSWTTIVSELGQRHGFFKKQDLVLDITYTQGGGETLQPVLSGAVDIGVGIGTSAALGAYAKGAPIRIIGANMTGTADLIWFVKSDSPLKSMQDVNGHTFAFGSRGASTEIVGKALLEQLNVKAEMVATGNLTATMTMAMSGQVDVGWTAPPIYFDALKEGKIRILATGADVEKYRNQTVRVVAANADSLASKRDAIERFFKAYKETIAWMYSDDPVAASMLSEMLGQSQEVLDETAKIYTHEAIDIGRVTDLEGSAADGVQYKLLSGPLTEEQLREVYVKLD